MENGEMEAPQQIIPQTLAAKPETAKKTETEILFDKWLHPLGKQVVVSPSADVAGMYEVFKMYEYYKAAGRPDDSDEVRKQISDFKNITGENLLDFVAYKEKKTRDIQQ